MRAAFILSLLIAMALLPPAAARAGEGTDAATTRTAAAASAHIVPLILNAEGTADAGTGAGSVAGAGEAAAKPDEAGSTTKKGGPAVQDSASGSAAGLPAEADAESIDKPGEAATDEAKAERAKDETTAAAPPPPPSLSIDINLTSQRMTVTENGVVKYTWAISSARAGYRTPTGTFKPQWLSRMWYSRQYDYAPMPHAIFFSGGTAIHATYATGMLGRPASHGCVRLAPSNAATLYKLVGKHGKDRTRISVHGVPSHRPPSVASKRLKERYASLPRGYRYPPGYGGYAYSYASGYAAPRAYYVKPRRVQRGYSSAYSPY